MHGFVCSAGERERMQKRMEKSTDKEHQKSKGMKKKRMEKRKSDLGHIHTDDNDLGVTIYGRSRKG